LLLNADRARIGLHTHSKRSHARIPFVLSPSTSLFIPFVPSVA
jgi:hypothetical protein